MRDPRAMQLLEVVRLFERTTRDTPISLAEVFLFICAKDGCLKQEIEEELDLTTSSSSRLIDWLGPEHKLSEQPGLGYIEKRKDPPNWRRIRVWLTPKGRAVYERAVALLFDGAVLPEMPPKPTATTVATKGGEIQITTHIKLAS